ncbi:MAG: TIGR02147 family protein, partial [Fibrobacteria bacterium]|nr:TIGR02147 family protein [Fibrobacteria bacterium]
MKTLTEYLNYRDYLRDYYLENKTKNKYFSYRYFASKAGIKSPNFLKQVIEGDRNLTRKMLEKFTSALKLRGNELKYFQFLVQFNQAKTTAEKQESYTGLRRILESVDPRLISRDLYYYFSKWYNVVIRELVCMHNFNDDFSKIARSVSPPIRPSEARKSLALLLELGLLEKTEEGNYIQKDPILSTESEVKSMVLRKFNARMIECALDALDTHSISERHIS